MTTSGGPAASNQLADTFRLDGRTAVVTGGAGGLGSAISSVLARAGAAVLVADRDLPRAVETASAIRDEGGTAEAFELDVTDRDAHDRAVDRATALLGPVRVWCNAAGVPAPHADLVDLPDVALRTVLDINLFGTLYGCQAAASAMSDGGAIVNIASSVADVPMAGNGSYTLSKIGVASITQILALELGPKGIRVNALAPGAVATRFTERYYTDDAGRIDPARRDEWIAEMSRLGPLGIPGTAMDQALLALYLVSDAARFVTGQVVRANGGWTMG